MTGHAQVIVGAPNRDWLLSPTVLVSAGKVRGETVHLLEDPVRVIVLLVHDLLMEELLVREGLTIPHARLCLCSKLGRRVTLLVWAFSDLFLP